jgi:hypothetical protein
MNKIMINLFAGLAGVLAAQLVRNLLGPEEEQTPLIETGEAFVKDVAAGITRATTEAITSAARKGIIG